METRFSAPAESRTERPDHAYSKRWTANETDATRVKFSGRVVPLQLFLIDFDTEARLGRHEKIAIVVREWRADHVVGVVVAGDCGRPAAAGSTDRQYRRKGNGWSGSGKLQTGRVRNTQLERSVHIARQARGLGDGSHHARARQSPGFGHVDGDAISGTRLHQVQRISRRPGAFVGQYRQPARLARDLGHLGQTFDRLLHDLYAGVLQALQRAS